MRIVVDQKMQAFLDELGDEYKELLLRELIERTGPGEDLSISKLISIDNDIKGFMNRKFQMKSYRRFQILGLLYSCMGIFMYILSEIMASFQSANHLTPSNLVQLLSIIIALTGILAYILPILINYTNHGKRQATDKATEYEVVAIWKEIEGICNDLSTKNKAITNSSVIQVLSQEKLITEEEREELVSFLRFRNAIVHDSRHKATNEELKNSIHNALRIVANIYARLSPDVQG